MMNNSATVEPINKDVNSGRYTVKPKTVKKEKSHAEEYQQARELPQKKSEPEKEVPAPEAPKPIAQPSMFAGNTVEKNIPAESEPKPSHFEAMAPQPVSAEEAETQEEGFFQQARDMVIGGSPQSLDEYRSFLPPDDPRRNLLEIQVAPLFLYNESTSSYWYRSYNNFAPGFSLASNIWFTPLFGIEVGYKKTIAGSVRNSPSSESYASAAHEWMNAGLRFRRFFGMGKSVPVFTLGLDYREYTFKLPAEEQQRVRLKSGGPRVTAETKIPSGLRYQWVYGLEVAPFTKTQELTSGVVHQSGTESETFGIGFSAGGEYKLARTSRMFFKLSYYMERSLYSGPANRADPNTGTTPTNVPVNNTFTMFELGYIWGR
ncbi:MAG: hypothetical protein AB7F59_13875 [Bdellovibrionales bacterium]